MFISLSSFSLPLSLSPFSHSLNNYVSLIFPSLSPVEIGFTKDTFSVPEGSSSDNICVAIFKPETRNDIEPSLAISITVILENSTYYSKLYSLLSPGSKGESMIILVV